MTVANDAIEMPPVFTDKKQLMTRQNSQKSNIFTKFFAHCLSLISATKYL